MSRSFKKPFVGHTTAKSEKEDKQIYNRRDRRKVKRALESGESLPIRIKTGERNFDKDGKHYSNRDEDRRK